MKVADSATASEDRGYAYDAAWNLNYRTNNATLQTFSVDGLNQLTNSTPGGVSTYDGNGNLVSSKGGILELAYDDENRLSLVRSNIVVYGTNYPFWQTLYYYDGKGRLRLREEMLVMAAPQEAKLKGKKPACADGFYPDSGDGLLLSRISVAKGALISLATVCAVVMLCICVGGCSNDDNIHVDVVVDQNLSLSFSIRNDTDGVSSLDVTSLPSANANITASAGTALSPLTRRAEPSETASLLPSHKPFGSREWLKGSVIKDAIHLDYIYPSLRHVLQTNSVIISWGFTLYDQNQVKIGDFVGSTVVRKKGD